jgi:hypothetical protein
MIDETVGKIDKRTRAWKEQAMETRDNEESSIEDVADFGEDDWKPASNLPSPQPRAGYLQRWIRVETRDGDDRQNFAKAFAEGWRPRTPETLPKGFYLPVINGGDHTGLLGMRGMILCELPEKKVKQREAYYRGIHEKQMQAVERDVFKAEQPGVPFHSETSTKVIKGRAPTIQDDM